MDYRSRRTQYLITVTLSIIAASVGIFITWPAAVIPKFHKNQTNIEISDTEISWMVAMTSPGHIVGSLLMGQTADKIGRRFTVLGSIIPCLIGSIAVVFAHTAWPLYVARFLWGAAYGMVCTVYGVYLSEIADKEIRGTVNQITKFMMNFGNFFTMAIGPFVSYSMLNYVLLIFPIFCLLTSWWIPESPYYYLKEGKMNNAKKALIKIRGCKDEKLLDNELSQLRRQVKNEMRHASTAKELFSGKQYRKAVILSFGLSLTQVLSGQLVIQHYVGLIVEESQFPLDMATVLIIFGGMKFVVAMLSSVVVDRVGRRPLLISTYLCTSASLSLVCIYFLLLDVVRVNPSTLKPFGFLPFTGILLSAIISTLGYIAVLNFLPAELFPMNVKSIAVMFLHIFGGVLNFTIARGYQITKDWIGLSGVFGLYTIASLAGGIISLFVPETKGKSLKEIQEMLQGDKYEADLECVFNDGKIESREIKDLVKK